MAGIQFLRKVAGQLPGYPGGQIIYRNLSILHHFRDKCIFAFYVEIQDDRQIWRETIFLEKWPVDAVNTLGVKIFAKIALPCTVFSINAFFVFYAKIQDSCKKWWENHFWEKSPDDSTDTLGVKKFCRNHSILHLFLDKCIFAILCRNSRWPPKFVGK